jgi:hypothetical protein
MSDENELRRLYLELIKRCLTGMIYEDPPRWIQVVPGVIDYEPKGYDRKWREWGRDWPSQAHSMIGLRRMNNIQFCVERVLADNIPGDFIETGVYRGGATIFMRALLKAYGVRDRLVWVADSFEGLPKPEPGEFPQDALFAISGGELAVPLDRVKHNFELYDLLDDRVRFLKGWFKDTLPGAPIERLAVVRLDGDLYQSTMDALTHLYPKLSPGGFLIVDDYYVLSSCYQAVQDYRAQNGIHAEIISIDNDAIYWRREM